MAELVGVIASAVTFGTVVAQLMNSVACLKDYCEQIRNLPSDIERLMRDIEVLGLVLGDIEADFAQKSIASALNDSKYVLQSLELCREAAVGLEAMYEDLAQDVQSARRIPQSYAIMKLVMRRNKIDKYKARLQDTIRLLLLSQQCYTRALMQAQPELIVQEIARRMKDSSIEAFEDAIPEPGSHERNPMFYPAKRHYSASKVACGRSPRTIQNKGFVWHASLPPWVTTKALELSGLRFPGGWKWIFRTYNLIPRESKAVDFSRSGDIRGLQNIFVSKQASPFDRIDINGYTLLHYADGPNRHDVLQFLLNEGADMSIAGHFNQPVTPLYHMVWSGSLGGKEGHPLLPSLRVLLPRSEEVMYETPDEIISGFMSAFHGTTEEFLFCQQRCYPSFYQMPQWTRVAVAARAASGFWDAYHMPETIRTVLGEGALEAKALQQEWASENYSERITLVHCVARKIGGSQAGLQRCDRHAQRLVHREKRFEGSWIRCDEFNKHETLYKSWNGLFREFLLAVIDLHQIVDHKTPLISFLHGYLYRENRPKNESSACVMALRSWLAELKAAGVNLDIFGRKEMNLWKSGNVQREVSSCGKYGRHWKRLINFVYGALPSDWYIWFSESSDTYAGDFWNLLEQKTEVMPGGWPAELPCTPPS